MKTFLIILAVLFSLVLLFGGGGFLWYLSVTNAEVGLVNRKVAKEKENEAVFDNMWKTRPRMSRTITRMTSATHGRIS